MTSGASTPSHIIEKVYDLLQKRENRFMEFSNKTIPLIDQSIKEFFTDLEKNSRFAIMKDLIRSTGEYCLRSGKRVRPLLLILSYLGFKGEKKDLSKIIDLAACVEIMHSFLLIHDDIMDRASLRRGAKSMHVICEEKFRKITHNDRIGEDVALVLGDILFAEVIGRIAGSRIDLKTKNSFLKVFSSCYSLTGWGQILDSIYSSLKELTVNSKVPENISQFKTAYYTVFYPVYMGYILTGKKSERMRESIEKFAIPLGVGFQIRDDIIGIFGDKHKTGKSVISDITEGKFTQLINMTLKNLSEKKKREFIQTFVKKKKKSDDIKKIKDMILQSNARQKCSQLMDDLFKKAQSKLQLLKSTKEMREVLTDLITYLQKV